MRVCVLDISVEWHMWVICFGLVRPFKKPLRTTNNNDNEKTIPFSSAFSKREGMEKSSVIDYL